MRNIDAIERTLSCDLYIFNCEMRGWIEFIVDDKCIFVMKQNSSITYILVNR